MKAPGGMLVPCDEPSREVVARWKLGQGVTATVRRFRNLQHHRKFFALLTVIAENSDTFDNTDKALAGVKLAAGHVDWIPHPATGELVPVPRSISFASMDQSGFDLFWDRALSAVIKHILPAMNRVSLDRAIDAVMDFA